MHTQLQASIQDQVTATVGALVGKQSAELLMMGTRVNNLEVDREAGLDAL